AAGTIEKLCLRQFLEANVAERDGTVVALEKNRAGLINLTVDLTARRFQTLDVVVNLFAVEDHSDLVADDRGLGGLPLAPGLGGKHARGGMIVDRAVAALGRLADVVIAEDLNLVAAAQVEAAVGIVRHLEVVLDGK